MRATRAAGEDELVAQSAVRLRRLIAEGVRLANRLSVPVGIGAAEPSESVAELAPLLRALFDAPESLLDRAGLDSLRAGRLFEAGGPVFGASLRRSEFELAVRAEAA